MEEDDTEQKNISDITDNSNSVFNNCVASEVQRVKVCCCFHLCEVCFTFGSFMYIELLCA